VYPEELEDLLNRSPYVLESMVYGQQDKNQGEVIAAQIVVDAEAFIAHAESHGVKITDSLMRDMIAHEIESVNRQVAPFKQIRKYTLRDREFEKTTTQKVKRYLVRKE
jgi:long-chain acyl-CoA synthetase